MNKAPWEERRLMPCPRCNAALLYRGEDDLGSLSRTTRDAGASIMVCEKCGRAEAFNAVPFTEWPLSIDDLMAEEGVLINRFRTSTIVTLSLDDLTTDEDESETA